MEVALTFIDKVKAKQKIIFNSFWVILDKVIRMLGGLIVGVWVTRYLGPYNFGKLNYATSIIVICLPLVNMGMNNIVLTELIRRAGLDDASAHVLHVGGEPASGKRLRRHVAAWPR